MFVVWIKYNSGVFLIYEYYLPEQVKRINDFILILFSKIRSQAIPLVDSFNLTDYLVNTPLGSFSGDIYNGFFEKIKLHNPLNDHPYKQKMIQVLNRSDISKEHGPSL